MCGTATSGLPRNTSLVSCYNLCLQPRAVRRTDSVTGALQGAPAELPQGFFALVLVEMLQKQLAVEVIQLVLEQPGLYLIGFDGDLVALEVVSGQVHLF